MKTAADWSVYNARCVDGSLYTGIAKDVSARLAAHNAGRGAAYTRSRRPVKLVYKEAGLSRSAALSREAGIKSLDRPRKLSLVKAARKLLAAALLLLTAASARAVPSFTKEDPVVLSSAAPQAFTYAVPASFTYPLRMYFLRASSGTEIGSASSADGVAWVEDAAAGRLSTATLPAVSASSITGCGVLPLTGGGFRMEYSILSSTGAYRIHSATSADGLAWANEAGARVDGGATYLGSPKVVKLSDGSWRMFWVSGAAPAARRVYTARSLDQGVTWGASSVVVSTTAFEVGASALTNGLVRLYYSAPVSGASSATAVVSALSSDAGATLFTAETGIRLSTSATSGTLGSPVPAVATDTFRWRLYYQYFDPAIVSSGDVHSALTAFPAPAAMSPAGAQNVQSTVSVTVTGDVFSTPAPTVTLSLSGGPPLSASGVTRVDDQTLTMSFDVLDQPVGRYDLTVVNADGQSTTLSNAFLIDYPGGSVSMVGNLLRPREGVPVTITITTFENGHLLARLYTLDGRPVRTLYDAPVTKGIRTLTWDGRDGGGAPVASGVYLLRTSGPKIDLKSKIVVIR
ncbi:MAG: GIY-YIG nuclease family protein [Elusimicrobia bacterium]|nr:GIY-YIG nuclease family protein [Elusimicrobiota bacterium]